MIPCFVREHPRPGRHERRERYGGHGVQAKGRKNAAGSWLLWKTVSRAVWAVVVMAVVSGVVLGLAVGEIPGVRNAMPWWSTLAAAVLAFGVTMAVIRHTDATWRRGLEAERRVGDRIEHALVVPGCAFAHDVKEALGEGGNVDHVVLTRAGVWVVETKAAWLGKGAFQDALQQTAANVERVRRALAERGVEVRGALVIADNREPYEEEFDWNGELVTAFRLVSFWRRLQVECVEDNQSVEIGKAQDLARKVWSLGSTGHREA